MNSVEIKEEINKQYRQSEINYNEYQKETEDVMQNSIENLRGYQIKNARKYGQRIQQIDGVYAVKNEEANRLQIEYENAIKEYKRMHDEQYKQILAIMQELEKKQINSHIKQTSQESKKAILRKELETGRKELAKLAINGELDEIETQIKELKEKSRELNEEISEREDELKLLQKEEEKILKAVQKCEKTMQEWKEQTKQNLQIECALRNDRFHNINEKYLIVLKEKNTLQKVASWISNIVSGKKRFEKEILDPLRDGIENLEGNKIEDLQKQISKQLEEVITYVENRTHVDRTNEEMLEIAKQDYITIIKNAKKDKENALNLIEISKEEELETKGA